MQTQLMCLRRQNNGWLLHAARHTPCQSITTLVQGEDDEMEEDEEEEEEEEECEDDALAEDLDMHTSQTPPLDDHQGWI